MNILLANESHIPGMIRLLQQVGQVHRDIRPDIFRGGAQKYDEAALAELLKDPSRPIFIAEEEETVLGYCFCIHKAYADDPVLADRKELYIDDLCVDENCRGQGIGKKIYEDIVRYAKMRGVHSVTLNVWCCNEGAMKFYEKLGLKPQKIGMELVLEEADA